MNENEKYIFCESVADAWGKLPSGILEGNLFDLGSFSECLHIDRNGELYQTKYCLAEMQLDLIGTIPQYLLYISDKTEKP